MGSSLNSITDIKTGSYLIINTLAEKINLDGACLFTTTDEGKCEIVASRGTLNEEEQRKQ
jgi:hypothetical protein